MAFSLLLLCLICEDGVAYINPSSGYILWQALFGAIVGSMFFAKKIWFFLKNIFAKEKAPDSTQS